MAEMNWGAAQVPNFFAGAVQSQQAGQRRRDELAARSALAMYGADPEGAIAALRPVDPDGALRLEQEREARRVRARAEQQEAERKAAIAQAASGDVAGGQVAAAGDPDALAAISKLDEDQRAKAKERAGILVGVFSKAEGMKPDQAEAYKQQIAPSLVASGMFTQEQVDGFAMTPENIASMKAQALGLKGMLDQQNQDREFASRDADRQADNARDQARLKIAQQQADTSTFRAHKAPAGRGGGGGKSGKPGAYTPNAIKWD